jgi:tRNA (adenine-N(1)-)-methyltransferase non-catalytic subunit
MDVADVYSVSRRTAFVTAPPASFSALPEDQKLHWSGDEDFPLNPTMLLNTNVQTAKVREWQVLPGRTHPHMTGRGGAEGYLFTAVRVIPAEGKVEARGKFVKKRVAEVELENGASKLAKVEQSSEAVLPIDDEVMIGVESNDPEGTPLG